MARVIHWKSPATIGGAIVLVAIAGVVTAILYFLGNQTKDSAAPGKQSAAGTVDENRVVLPPAKLQAANLETGKCRWQELRSQRTVPGRLTFNESLRLAVTLPVACVVKQVLVEPDQRVNQGDELAVLSSAEIGLARDEVARRTADLKLAEREETRSNQIAENVTALLDLLAQQPRMEEVERSVAGKPMGEYRDKIVSAYSRLLLAEASVALLAELEKNGGLGAKTVRERKSARETAAAEFGGLSESARFAVEQNKARDHAAAEEARRLLAIANERLSALLGPAAGTPSTGENKPLSEFTLVAPRSGRIVRRHVVAGGRTEAGKPLFELADTDELWIAAEIHERDWADLTIEVGDVLEARVPAVPGQLLHGKVHFIGPEVSDESRAVSLVAEIHNHDGKLKPGMFAWIDVPTSKLRKSLVVPSGAICRHEEAAFVFVPEGEGAFRRVDVKTGLETGDVVEIQSGLSEGQTVVTQGAFYLKSELLLEREAE
jgi:cobalt-zinc-cadmium efflux system membrane fusion protein